ncbi:MAG: insulinase family protein [Acidobacteriota bacterium]
MTRWSTGLLLILVGSWSLQSIPEELRAREIQRPQPRFFQALKEYDESGSLARAVFRKGLTVLIEEHPQDDLVLVATYFRVGRLDASPELCEIAAEIARRTLSRGVHDAGGLVDVEVGDRVTSARTIIPSIGLRDAMRAHLDLFHLKEDEWEMDRAFAGGREKRAASCREPFVEELQKMVTGSGSDEPAEQTSEQAVTLEALSTFLANFYTPADSVLNAVGSVRRENVLTILAQEMENFQMPVAAHEDVGGQKEESGQKAPKEDEPETKEPQPAGAGEKGFQYRQQRADVVHPMILVGFRVPSEGESGALAIDLARYALAAGQASLLELPRENEEEAPAFVSSRFQSLRNGRLLSLQLIPTGTLERAEVRLMALLQTLSETELPRRLLNRAKAMMVTDRYRDLESLDTRSRLLAMADFRDGYKSRDRFPDQVSDITARDVQQAIRQFCADDKAVLFEVLPSGFEPRSFTTESFRETLDILIPPAVERQEAFLEAIQSMGEVAPYRPPVFKPGFADLPPRRSSVLRGPEIYLREDHRGPLVHVGFFFTGGILGESPSQAGLTRFLSAALLENLRLADRGTELLNLESSGARVSTLTEYDYFGVEAVAPASVFNDSFFRLVDWLNTRLSLNEADVKAAAGRLAYSRSRLCSGPDPLVSAGLSKLFGDHPYSHGLGSRPTPFSLEQVDAWKKSLIEKIHPTIVVSGDISGTAFLEGLISKLSHSDYTEGKLPGTRVTYPEKLPIRESNDQHADLFFDGPRAGSFEIAMLDVARHILNGTSGRLTLRLRNKGLGYQGSLSQLNLVRGGAVWLSVKAAPGKTQDAADAAFREATNLTEKTVPPFDFRAAQVAAISDWLLRQRNPEAYLCDTMEASLAQEPADYGSKYVLNLRSLRMGEVEQALERYVGGIQ